MLLFLVLAVQGNGVLQRFAADLAEIQTLLQLLAHLLHAQSLPQQFQSRTADIIAAELGGLGAQVSAACGARASGDQAHQLAGFAFALAAPAGFVLGGLDGFSCHGFFLSGFGFADSDVANATSLGFGSTTRTLAGAAHGP